jgi:hypothetical protein
MAFSIMMLSTDLHRYSLDRGVTAIEIRFDCLVIVMACAHSEAQKKKITRDEWLENNRKCALSV